MKSEKFNVITLILIVLLIIVTLGASQVKANEDNLLLPGDDYSEAIFTKGRSEQISYSGKEMPEAAAGLQRIVFSAQDFQPYNPAFWDFYTPRANGCIALRIPDCHMNSLMVPICLFLYPWNQDCWYVCHRI